MKNIKSILKLSQIALMAFFLVAAVLLSIVYYTH
jgi:hypothetical protein